MLPERAVVIGLAAGWFTATFSPRVHAEAIDIVLIFLAADTILLNLAAIAAEPSSRVRTVSRSEWLVLAAFCAAHLLGRTARIAADTPLAAGAARLATVTGRFRGAALTGRADALLRSVAAGLATAEALGCFTAFAKFSIQAGLALQATLSATEEVQFLTASWAASTLEACFPVDEGCGQGSPPADGAFDAERQKTKLGGCCTDVDGEEVVYVDAG